MAVAVLFTTSCAKEDISSSIANGETVEVTFTANLPELGTRAIIGEGEYATTLKFFVYEYQNDEVIGTYLPAVKLYTADDEVGTNVITSDNKFFNFSLSLIKGMKYNIVFWADKGTDSPYSVVEENGIPTGVISADYSNVNANDDTLDAFFGALKNFDPAAADAQARAREIKLYRPFAQLNAKTNDIAAVTASGATLTKSSLTVETYTTLDLFSGAVGGLANVTFKPNNVLDNNGYISMNYLLAPETKCTADVTFNYEFDGATVNFPAATYTYVPLQRNYKTNILGSLITKSTDFTVEIKPGFGGEEDYEVEKVHVATSDSLVAAVEAAAATGGEIVLTDDIELNSTLSIADLSRTASAEQKVIVIDGKGRTLTYTGSNRAIDITATNVNVTIKNLTIDFAASYCQRGINYNTAGTLTLDNVKVNEEGKNVTYALNLPGNSDNAIVSINNSSLTGNIALNVWGEDSVINAENSLFNSVDKTEAENYSAIALNNDGTTAANGTIVTINGGKITALDQNGEPSNAVRNATQTGEVVISNTTEVIGLTTSPVAVVKYDGYNEFYSCATLQAAINKAIETNASSVVLVKDVELTETVTVAEGGIVVLDLNGKTITANACNAIQANEGAKATIKNGKIVAYEAIVRAVGGEVVIENGEYTQTGTAVDSPATYRYAIDSRANGKITINGGVFKSNNGMINVSSEVIINGGKFENIVEKSMTRHFAYVSAALTINDGEFYGKANGSAGGCFFCGAASACAITINGGKFTSLWTSGSVNKIFEIYYGGSINVTGGLFNSKGGIATYVVENTDAATKDAYPYVAK